MTNRALSRHWSEVNKIFRIIMSEHRSDQRINVSWPAAIQLVPGRIVSAKIINFSTNGLRLQCAVLLKDGQTYQMMMEVPDHRNASLRTKVTCKATCMYVLLSDGAYHAGMRYFDVPTQHQALINSWCGVVPVKAKVPVTPTVSEEPNAVV